MKPFIDRSTTGWRPALSVAFAIVALGFAADAVGTTARARPTARPAARAAATAPTPADAGTNAASADAAVADASPGLRATGPTTVDPARPSFERRGESCMTCHLTQREPRLRDPAEQVRASVHGNDQIGCSGCHGGRRDDPTVRAHDLASGFLPKPSAAQTVERCGGCHADARAIRRLNGDIQVDQLALFRADRHGQVLAAGDPHAPSCASCHGTHAILSGRVLTSSVHPLRVAETCARCHGNTVTTTSGANPADAPSAWRTSVHGEALADRGNERAPSCNGCHGAHGEVHAAGGADHRCTTCHADEARAYERSPHAAAFARLGFGACSPCHGRHAIAPATGGLLGAGGANVCIRCHAEGQKAFDRAHALEGSRAQALAALDHATDKLRAAERMGLRLADATLRLEEARGTLARLDVSLHALDADEARALVQSIRDDATTAERQLDQVTARRARQARGWLVAVAFLAGVAALFALRAREAGRAQRENGN